MPQTGTRVAVTGASGYLASRLIGRLCEDDKVERVLGFDVRAPQFDHPKFVGDQIDVRDPALEARLADVDVVVHLAFIMDPIRDEAKMRDVNVNGSQNVFRSAAAAGVKKIVYTSSAVAYGAHRDNDVPLTEESPLRANLDFSYAAHKLEVEFVVREVQDEHPDIDFTIFRPSIVFGSHVDNAWSHSMEVPILFMVQGHRAPLQFVHEDDVARALHEAIVGNLSGVYNLAPEGWLEPDEMISLLGRRAIEVPEPVAFSLLERLWSLGMAEAPAGMLHYTMHPWVVTSKKLQDTGFTFSRSNRDVFAEAAQQMSGYVRLGRKRVKRSDLRNGALAGIGVIAGLVSLRTAKKRRTLGQ